MIIKPKSILDLYQVCRGRDGMVGGFIIT